MPKKYPKLTEEFLIGHAQDRFNHSRTWREEYVNGRWTASSDLYDSKFKTTDKTKSDTLVGQGRLFIPKTYAHVQRIMVDVLDTFFFDKEEITDVVSWRDIPAESRLIVKALLNYRLNGHPINFYQEAYEAVLDALKNKIGVFKVYPRLTKKNIVPEDIHAQADRAGIPWDEDPAFMDFTTQLTGKGHLDEMTSKELRAVYEELRRMVGENPDYDIFEPVIECIPYEDIFFDTKATWKDYQKFTIIHRMTRSYDYLKKQGYKNLDQIELQAEKYETDEIKEQRTWDQGSPFTLSSNFTADRDNVYIYEVWTHLDVNGDGFLQSCSYIVAGDSGGPQVVIRGVEENGLPYKFSDSEEAHPPFVVGSAFPESHKLYGKDLPEIVEGLQRETNAQRNQEREAVALSIRSHVIANRSSNIDMVSLVNRRIGGITLADDTSEQSIRVLATPPPPAAVYKSQQRTDQDFFEATSLPPNMMGFSRPGEETATESQSNIMNANKKIAQIIRNLAYSLFLPAFRLMLRLEQEYESDAFIKQVTGRILGYQFAADQLPPTSFIQGDFDLTVSFGQNKQFQLQRLLMVMERANLVNANTMQMVQAGVVNPQEATFINTTQIFKRILPLLGEKNTEEFDVQAQPPPPQGQQAAGLASQPGMSQEAPQPFGAGLNMEGVGL